MKKLTRIVLILLVIVLTVSSQSTSFAENKTHWTDDGIVASTFSGGNGSETNPYLISSASELAYLAKLVNENAEGSSDSYQKFYKLSNSIDLSGYLWTPVGFDNSRPFYGFFDGNGYSVQGMLIEDIYRFTGLFGFLDYIEALSDNPETPRLKNLTVSGEINLSGEIFNTTSVAGIAALAYTWVDNCHSNVAINLDAICHEKISGELYDRYDYSITVCGLADYSDVVNCSSSGDININCVYAQGTDSRLSVDLMVGGLIAFGRTAENSYSTTNIRTTGVDTIIAAGGIGGFTYSAVNCYSTGDIVIENNERSHIASIIGWTGNPDDFETIRASNCYWLQDANVEQNANNIDGVGDASTSENSYAFAGEGTNWVVADKKETNLVSALNKWVNQQADEKYLSWRSALSEEENNGFPLLDTFLTSPDYNAIIGFSSGDRFTQGDTISFTAIGSGTNKPAVFGNHRWRPSFWQTNPSGSWTEPPYSADIPTSNMSIGEHLLTVTFSEERFNGSNWALTGRNASQTIAFTIIAKIFKISSSAGTGGYISPSGVIESALNSEKTFMIFANKGYVIHRVSIDGVNQGNLSTYTFTNIDKDHSIHADFALDTILPVTGDDNTIIVSTLFMLLSLVSLLLILRNRKRFR